MALSDDIKESDNPVSPGDNITTVELESDFGNNMDTDVTVSTEEAGVKQTSRPRIIASVGTLNYTKVGLITLFVWMLWGELWYLMMDQVMKQILPITLKGVGSSNVTIALIVGTIPMLLNAILNPIISTKSDRHRGRFGRRIPYLAFATPFMTVFMIAVGFAPQLGGLLSRLIGISPTASLFVIIVSGSIAFQFFYLFVASVYYYLFQDVVPPQFLGRFIGYYRVVGNGAGFLFSWFIVGKAETHTALIYTGIGILYCICFLLMCWRVKEGSYSPPQPMGESRTEIIKTYFKECYSKPFYLWFFAGMALSSVSLICRGLFTVFFARENIGLSLDQYGKVMAFYALLAMILAIPLGFLVDKVHPIRVNIMGLLVVVVVSTISFFVIHTQFQFTVLTILTAVSYSIQFASTHPLLMRIFPRKKYGQFCSAQTLVISLVMIIAQAGGGVFLDFMNDYRYLYAWDAVFTGAALVCMLKVYQGWKRYGGDKNYAPPQ